MHKRTEKTIKDGKTFTLKDLKDSEDNGLNGLLAETEDELNESLFMDESED